MKKIIFILTAVFLCTAAMAQTSDKKPAPAPAQANAAKKQAMHYVYMGGKMSTCYGETYDAMTTDMKLHDGMMLSTKGELTMKDGKKVQLKEGECVDMNGKVMDHKMAHSMMMDKKKEEMKK